MVKTTLMENQVTGVDVSGKAAAARRWRVHTVEKRGDASEPGPVEGDGRNPPSD